MNINKIETIGLGYYRDNLTFLKIKFNRRTPTENDIVIKVQYAGICGSDVHTLKKEWLDWTEHSEYLIAGHEVFGTVEYVGSRVTKFLKGDYALVGCMVGGNVDSSFFDSDRQQEDPDCVYTYACEDKKNKEYTQGGYSTYIVVDSRYAFTVPEDVKPEKAAPLACCALTTYAPLRQLNINNESTVLVIGLGGLGGTCVKFCKALGARVIAFDKYDKQQYADKLEVGFSIIEDNIHLSFTNKFDYIISTASTAFDVSLYMPLLKYNGTFVFVGLPSYETAELMTISVKDMILKWPGRKIMGTLIAGLKDSQECIDFCVLMNLYPDSTLIESTEEDLNDAYSKLEEHSVNGRFVIDFTKLLSTKILAEGGVIDDYHEVVSGDTFSQIAQKYGITTDLLKALNPEITDINNILLGKRLRISSKVPTSNQTQSYGVNDTMLLNLAKTLNSISRKHTGNKHDVITLDSLKTLYPVIKQSYNLARNLGFTPEQASGLLGNILQESKFNINYDDGSRLGPFHFLGSLKKHFLALPEFSGKLLLDYIGYLWNWVNIKYKDPNNLSFAKSYLMDHSKPITAKESAKSFFKRFERANDWTGELRGDFADVFYKWFNNTELFR